MGYKILGFVVWQGGKLYFRRRTTGFGRKAALGGLTAAVLVGAIVAGKQAQQSSD
jgi:hypothetical protein